jgi:sugar phosphate isomerase/epimerase
MKKSAINRREFVGALAASAAVFQPGAFGSSKPPEEKRNSEMKVGLYSVTYLGIWYRGQALPLEDVIKRAKKYGYDGVELDGKRPHANPLDMSTRRCRELRRIADGEGIEIVGVAANNDFSSPMPEHRETQVCYVRHLIQVASDLGAPKVRVFFAWPGVVKHPQVGEYETAKRIWQYTHQDIKEEEIWAWCREGLREVSRFASDAGVTLALQNHAPVYKDTQDVLRMVKEVNSPALKVAFDPWGVHDRTPEYIRQSAREVGSLQTICHFGGVFERDRDGKIKASEPHFPEFVAAMKEIGYKGYLNYEMCSEPPVVNGQVPGIERAEHNAELAVQYMRALIKQA